MNEISENIKQILLCLPEAYETMNTDMLIDILQGVIKEARQLEDDSLFLFSREFLEALDSEGFVAVYSYITEFTSRVTDILNKLDSE